MTEYLFKWADEFDDKFFQPVLISNAVFDYLAIILFIIAIILLATGADIGTVAGIGASWPGFKLFIYVLLEGGIFLASLLSSMF